MRCILRTVTRPVGRVSARRTWCGAVVRVERLSYQYSRVSSSQVLIILGVAAVTLVAVAVLRQAGIPAPVVLVVAGLVIGFLPFVPDVSLEPDVVLLGLLPLLVFDAAVTSSPTGFYRDARSIGALAVLLVVATAFGVAAVAHWAGHLSWPISFVLGTAVGPTDAAAATAVARRVGLPRRLLTILEGEALFNDATALVLYAAAVTAATTGHFSVAHTAGSIVYAVVCGTAIGLAVGIVGRWLRNRIDDPPIEIAGSILLAYVAYLPAEEAHASGVLAAVTAGLYLGWHSSTGAFSARSRLVSNAFWETLVFLVNAVLFTLVGLEFHTFRVEARGPRAAGNHRRGCRVDGNFGPAGVDVGVRLGGPALAYGQYRCEPRRVAGALCARVGGDAGCDHTGRSARRAQDDASRSAPGRAERHHLPGFCRDHGHAGRPGHDPAVDRPPLAPPRKPVGG